MNVQRKPLILAVLAAAVLGACGGGGSDAGTTLYPSTNGTDTTTPVDTAAVALAKNIAAAKAAAAKIVISSSVNVIPVNSTTEFTVTARVVDANGKGVAYAPVVFSATNATYSAASGTSTDPLGGTTSSGIAQEYTDASGNFTVNVKPNPGLASGNISVTASLNDSVAAAQNILIPVQVATSTNSDLQKNIAAAKAVATKIILRSTVSQITANATSAFTVTARVVNSAGQGVQYAPVAFTSNNASFSATSGGDGVQQTYTDASGDFVINVTPNPNLTSGAVELSATLDGSAAGGETLSLPISGTDQTNPPVSLTMARAIKTIVDDYYYTQKVSVVVTDQNGVVRGNIPVVVKAEPQRYRVGTGSVVQVGATETYNWAPVASAICPRSAAYPQSSDVSLSPSLDADGNPISKTDANGLFVFTVKYPATHASWVEYKVTATASTSSGAISDSYTDWSVITSDDATAGTQVSKQALPFYNSPYGTTCR